MSSELVSYRMVFVAAKDEGQDGWRPDHEIWRQGVAFSPVPIEFSAHDAIAAKGAAQCVRDGIHDIVDAFILKPFKAADLQTKLFEIQERRRTRKLQLEQDPV